MMIQKNCALPSCMNGGKCSRAVNFPVSSNSMYVARNFEFRAHEGERIEVVSNSNLKRKYLSCIQ